MILIMVGGAILLLSVFVGLGFLVYMLANLSKIVAFGAEYQETEATLIGFTDGARKSTINDDVTHNSILSYYNTYQGKMVE